MSTVGQHQTLQFTGPVRGGAPMDPTIVRGNDNILRAALNAHDADAGIHVQASALGSRPAAGTDGRLWATPVGSDAFAWWYDDGTNWRPLTLVPAYQMQAASATGTLALTRGLTFVGVTTSGGNVTLTLPAAASVAGFRVDVKKLDAANTLTLDGAGAETIDGAATVAWTTQYQTVSIVSDGTQWWTL